MTHEQAIQVLRSVLNAVPVKLTLSSQDIALAEQALQQLAKATEPKAGNIPTEGTR